MGVTAWALGIQSRHRRWAGLTFFRPAGRERSGGGEGRGGWAGWGGWGGGLLSVALPRGGGGAKGPPPVSSPLRGEPAHGLHPRFVVAKIWADRV